MQFYYIINETEFCCRCHCHEFAKSSILLLLLLLECMVHGACGFSCRTYTNVRINWTIQYSSHWIRKLTISCLFVRVCVRAPAFFLSIRYCFLLVRLSVCTLYIVQYRASQAIQFKCLNMDYELVCTCARSRTHTRALMKTPLFDFIFG